MRTPSSSIVTALAFTATLASFGLLSPPVLADGGSAAVSFSGDKQLFEDIHFDTGYLPADFPISLRIKFDLGGGLSLRADGEASIGAEDPVAVALRGIDGTGVFDMNVGPQLEVTVRLHFSVLGRDIDWEGPIPFDLPIDTNFDFRFAKSATFDPFLLDGQSVTVSDDIQDVELATIPISQAIIPIPGIGGSLILRAGGQLTSEFKGVAAEATAGVRRGDTVTSTVSYRGHSTTTGTIILKPTLEISLLSFSKDFSIDIPIDLPKIEQDWDLGSQEVSLAVPPPPAQSPSRGVGDSLGRGLGGGSADGDGTSDGQGGAAGEPGGPAEQMIGGCSVSASGGPLGADASLVLLVLGFALMVAGRRRQAQN